MSPERAQAIVDAFDAEFAPTATSVVTPPDELIVYISPCEGRRGFGVETGVRYFSPTCTRRGHWG